MPSVPLVVEGDTDQAFFQELLGRLYPQTIHPEFRNARGRDNIPAAITALLVAGVPALAVARDIDEGAPEQVVQSVGNLVYDYLKLPRPRDQRYSRKIEVAGRTVYVIAIGLQQDAALAGLGITSHALEDYLIKLLLEDSSLRQECSELQALLSGILPHVRGLDGSFNSSKDLFQLIKPMVKHGFSDTGAVQSICRNADPIILNSVLAPLLADLETVMGV